MVWVHLLAENASTGLLERFFNGAGVRRPKTAAAVLWLGQFPAPGADPMSEDERQDLVRSAAVAHSGLREIAFKLQRELGAKAPALKEALKAEERAFRLKRELQQLDVQDPEPARRREPLGEIRRGGKVIDVERLRRP